jgi:hypothetical protein
MVTLVGWAALLFGLLRMFAPEHQQGGPNSFTHAVMLLLFVLGAFLTFKACRESKN